MVSTTLMADQRNININMWYVFTRTETYLTQDLPNIRRRSFDDIFLPVFQLILAAHSIQKMSPRR